MSNSDLIIALVHIAFAGLILIGWLVSLFFFTGDDISLDELKVDSAQPLSLSLGGTDTTDKMKNIA